MSIDLPLTIAEGAAPQLQLIQPDWPAPARVQAYSTMRQQGYSCGVYAGLNLALHVGDESLHVEKNRQLLRRTLGLVNEPLWLNQVHQKRVVNAAAHFQQIAEADASFTDQPGNACVVMTADCLPVLFCNKQGSKVAAAHAGWRGLVAGVLEATVQAMHEPADEIIAWLGPAIGAEAFEVGEEVREAFVMQHSSSEAAFCVTRAGHYLADIYQLARIILQAAGVQNISGGGFCTFNDADQFYSYRRDGTTGRQASLIWLGEN